MQIPSSLRVTANIEKKSFPHIARWMDRIMDATIHGAVLLIPLVICTSSLDVLELPKQTLLVLLASIGFLAWLGKAVALKALPIHRSWLHVVAVMFVAVYALVGWMSSDRYISFFGTLGQMPWAVSTMVALLALYFVAVNRIRSVGQVYDLIFTFLLSSSLAALYGVLQMFGWYIFPATVTQANTFSSMGSVYSLTVFLVAPLVMSAGLVFHGCHNDECLLGSPSLLGRGARVVVWVTMILSGLVILMTDFWMAWVSLIFGTVLLVAIGFVRGARTHHPVKFVLPGLLIVISLAFLWLPTPPPFRRGLPAEVSPSPSASWNIAQQALRDRPLFGTGPGTWSYSYARYRDREVNMSPFWNIRFDRSFSQFLTLLSSVGVVGITLWILFLVSIVVKSASHLLEERDDDAWYALVTVFAGWATVVFTSFFYNYNVPHVTVFWMLSALLAAMAGGAVWVWDSKHSRLAFEGIATLFVLGLVVASGSTWFFGQRFLADVTFAKGVESFRAGQPVDAVIAQLDRARAMNPSADMYARNLAQAHLIKAAGLIQNNPTQEQAAVIQSEIKAAVEIALTTSSTNPANVDNFANLAMLYESIASFTRGADEAAISAYGEALKREPNNPVFITEVGKLYLLRSDAYRTLMSQGDAKAKADAKANMESNLRTAEEVLKRAIETKPDYMPARYFLGVVYERNGRLRESIQELGTIFQQNNKDLNVAFELSLLLYRDNQKAPSLQLMQGVVAGNPENVNAKWYLAAMYEEQGKLESALALISELEKQFPDNKNIKDRKTALEAKKKSTPPLPEPVIEPITGNENTNPVIR